MWIDPSGMSHCGGHRITRVQPQGVPRHSIGYPLRPCYNCRMAAATMRQLGPSESGDLRADGADVDAPREARTGQIMNEGRTHERVI